MSPTFGSLFAGIAGFDLGLERAGWRCAWQVEADPACRMVLRRHFPGIPIYEDVREVGEDLEPVDLVCGGFPCQDISVAGRRAGLAGARSGLWWEFHRILAALAPSWVLAENVAGLLSSNGGRDLGAILGGLAGLGYVGSWRVLDSQFFGVPQRRRRVFLVGHLGTEPIPEVLLEPEGLQGNPPPSREAGARVAATLTRGAESQGKGGYAGRRQEDDVNVVAAQCHGSNVGPMGTLRQGNGGITGGVPFVAQRPTHEVAPCLQERGGKGPDSDATQAMVLAYSATDYRDGAYEEVEQAGPLTTSADRTRSAPIAFQERGREGGRNLECQPDLAYSLTSPNGGGRAQENNILAAIPRRLTPVECSRLQGFPDDWNEWGLDEDGERVELSDSARYRQLGNAVTASVAEWIGERILAAHLEDRPVSPPGHVREGEGR